MDSKLTEQLEEAKVHYYAWRLWEAYNILRRFFDRLPFKPESAHAEYISMFARLLGELGKERDLLFYMNELEKWETKLKSPEISYSLAVVYRYLREPKWEKAKKLLETVIRTEGISKELAVKARLLLIGHFSAHEDVGSARHIFDSITPVTDSQLMYMVREWEAVILLKEGKTAQAKAAIQKVLKEVKIETDWYLYLSAVLILVTVLTEEEQFDAARILLNDIKENFAPRGFKAVLIQIKSAETKLDDYMKQKRCRIVLDESANVITVNNQKWNLTKETTRKRLLMLLLDKKQVSKQDLVRDLYSRAYEGEKDDKLIYYHVHTLRKELEDFGIPADAIVYENEMYRFVLDVTVLEKNHERDAVV